MNVIPTLKDRVSQISIGVFVLTIVVMLTSFTLYSMKKAKVAEELIQNDLMANIKGQVNQFIPSFLLPEQRPGIQLILERIKLDEKLEHALIIQDSNEIPEKFKNCRLNEMRAVTCVSNDLNSTAVLVPLNEGSEHFGYLLKSKVNKSPSSLKSVFEMVGMIVFILGIVFGSVYIVVTRLLSRTLPMALDDLVVWIEADLASKGNSNISLPFKELEDLRVKISEVIDRYNRSRDQAIIGQLTSGIMHDIKTPLQSIVTAMHLVEEQEKESPKRLARLENAHKMCSENLPLICNIIETTLDGNRHIKVDLKEANLVETIEASVLINKELAKLRSVKVLSELPEKLMIKHDVVQFSRVVSNILKNCIEAASESDILRFVKVSVVDTDHEIKMVIEDTGPGIAGHPEKVFRAFRTSKVRGTGLGLLITKKIVEAHSGSIVASNSSTLGGAIFEVIIPKINAEETV